MSLSPGGSLVPFSAAIPANAASRSRVVAASLLDVQTVDGNIYYWSDRALSGIPAAVTADGTDQDVTYAPWLMSAPTFTFNRSMQTDVGSFTLQNVSGDSVSRDFEKVTRRSALEGAFFIYRYWDVGAEFAWLEVHGTLTVSGVPSRIAELGASQLFSGQDDTPAGTYSESCQLVWGEKRCGATGDTECLYSYKTCQVTERYVGILTNFEQNFAETIAAVPTQVINRRRAL
jgi:hypothetical protein